MVFCSSGNKTTDPNKDPNAPIEKQKIKKPSHNHPAFNERVRERRELVNRHIRAEGIREPNVIEAMVTVPRHVFVRKRDLSRAYANHPLSIGYGQTISQPYIVGYMTQALHLDPNDKVLEIGTGSGYQAAVCAEIAKVVYTIEIVEPLAKSAQNKLKELGYNNVINKAGDGYFGAEEYAPFDAIIVTCAANFVPPPLIQQLKPGGRMILPVGSPFGYQTLKLITKDENSQVHSRRLIPVSFVPMLGQIEKEKHSGEK